MKKYYYFYKITNLINNDFYYGVHGTSKLEDGYMGSGTRLANAYNFYGIENFKKDILKFFDTMEEAYDYEKEIVNEDLIKDKHCYNIKNGGKGWNSDHLIVVQDKNGKRFFVHDKDPRYLNGELKALRFGKVLVVDKDGNRFTVDKDDPRYLSGELVHHKRGLIHAKDSEGNVFNVYKNDKRIENGILKRAVPLKFKDGRYIICTLDDPLYKEGIAVGSTKGLSPCKNEKGEIVLLSKDDERFKNGEFVGIQKNRVIVRDKEGNRFTVDKNDPRYLSGELKSINKNRKMSEKTKQLRSEMMKGKYVKEKNFMYGRSWYHKIENDKYINKAFTKEEYDKFKDEGWEKGTMTDKWFNEIKNGIIRKKIIRKKVWINNPSLKERKMINIENVESFIEKGWKKGMN